MTQEQDNEQKTKIGVPNYNELNFAQSKPLPLNQEDLRENAESSIKGINTQSNCNIPERKDRSIYKKYPMTNMQPFDKGNISERWYYVFAIVCPFLVLGTVIIKFFSLTTALKFIGILLVIGALAANIIKNVIFGYNYTSQRQSFGQLTEEDDDECDVG